MIRPEFFVDSLERQDISFFTGVPDSLLKNLCAYITATLPASKNIIAANEGGAVGLAAGYHLATGKIPVVYMQNSGEGNTVNPLMSLTDKEVYNIPLLLLIGWRGEPGVHDEPQHIKQGKVTLALLEAMGIGYFILSDNEDVAAGQIDAAAAQMRATGEAFALIIRKGTFGAAAPAQASAVCHTSAPAQASGVCAPALTLSREEAVDLVAESIPEGAVIVSTTGMISRELFEYRTHTGQSHERDFLTVGSMGHASQIALGVALNKPDRRVYCFDGDGASIMHLGNMAINGSLSPCNYVHVVFNNGAHDSVGGQPTVGLKIDLPAIAKAVGYKKVYSVDNAADLKAVLADLAGEPELTFIEVKVRKGARKDLGRPTTTPIQNKEALMAYLNK